MAGTHEGGKKAERTIKQKHGSDFYVRAGALGGKLSTGGGFSDPELAHRASKLGLAARRRKQRELENREGWGD